MPGVGSDATAEERWAAAARLADGRTDERLPRRRARAVAWIVVLVVVLALVGFGVGWFLPTSVADSDGSDPSTLRLVVQLGLLLLGILVGAFGFAWARRTGRWVTRWQAVRSPLSRREQRSVQRQIAGSEPLDEAHRDVVVAIAEQNQRATLGGVPIYAAVALFAASTAVSTDTWSIRLLESVVVVGLIAVFGWLAVLYRRTGRFLAAHRRA